MSMKRTPPVIIREPDPQSTAVADRLHLAIIRGKLVTTSKILDSVGTSVELTNNSGQTPLFCAAYCGHLDIVKLLLKLGADPNRRCSINCCTPVHAACWSGNQSLITSLLIAGGDLRYRDQQNLSPRDWAMLQPNNQSRLATLSLIESFRQVALKSNDLSVVDLGMSELNNSANTPSRSHCTSFKLPTKLRNSLASMGLVCSENSEYIGPLGNVQGTGFGKILYGRGQCAAALWPVPLVDEVEISDPDDDGNDEEADLNGLIPRGVAYKSGPTTEMVPRRWHQTPVTVRRMKDNQQPDLLFEELRSMSRLRHPGLMLLMGVSATQHLESVQLIYEPIFHGSLHHRLHIMGSAIPLFKRILILQQVCDALSFLHSKDLLHCSVSSHAVHLISTSRAKLGGLETLTEDHPNSRRVYRKVPSSHWDWLMPWLSPECVRGESLSKISDVYSFCCLVFETCTENLPWAELETQIIDQMWKRQCDYNKLGSGLVDQLDNAIPLHIGTFLKLGLQPDPDKRGDMDLQEIYLMLRLQAAVLCQSQQKEVQQQQQYTKHQHNHQQLIQEQQNRHHHQTKPPTGFKQQQHGWEAVKERMKKCNNSTVTEFSSPLSQSPVRPKDSRHENSTQTVHVLNECLEEETETSDDPIVGTGNSPPPQPPFRPEPPPRDMFVTPNYYADFSRTKNWNPPTGECAIKPASHTTERHLGQCPMIHNQYNNQDSGCGVTIYHTPEPERKGPPLCQQFTEEMKNAPPAPPATFYRPMTNFGPWQDKIDADNKEEGEASTSEDNLGKNSGVVVVTGSPSFTSTPRHHLINSVAAISAREDTGAKPKRSISFNPQLTSDNMVPRHFLSASKPTTEFVARLSNLFTNKIVANEQSPSISLPSKPKQISNIADTLNEGCDCVSRGVQCNQGSGDSKD